MTPPEELIFEYAVRRYHTDPEFYARVHQSVAIAVQRLPHEVEEEGLLLLKLGATLGLAMEWVDPVTGRVTDT